MSDELRTPRGTKDILPDDQKYWRFVNQVITEKCESFGCGKIDTPAFEYAEVFTKSIGTSSDIVTKEMYQVSRANTLDAQINSDDESRNLILRPEFTAGVVRAYIEHGMKIWSQPVKLYYEGTCFRYERPQSGRYRQFRQFGVEIFGDADPLTDASTIYLAYKILQKLGLAKDLVIDINSIGDASCRGKIKKKLTDYFEKFLPNLCEDCNRRYIDNPLRILDCKNEKCQRVINAAPPIVDMLCGDCKTHFKQVLENLDNMQIPYNLNSRLVRGLDYYTRTVFEVFEAHDTNRQLSLLGGGRYDGLVKLFGGGDVPAFGFAAGEERIIEKIKEVNVTIPEPILTEVSIIQIGDKARKKCVGLLGEIEDASIKVNCVLGKDSLKSQLRTASKLRAKIALIMGQREVLDNSIIIRDMIDGVQETIKITKLMEVLKAKLNK